MISNSSTETISLIKALPVALILSTIVILCLCGNILVILSVFTFRPLRTVQNFFIVSLAISDMLVAVMVMPFHIVNHFFDRWVFGKIFCRIFVTSDVLLCTSSILNLCAIALDRYWAISDPIKYARQRTIRRVLTMILIVWIFSALISIPPIITTMLGSTSGFENLDHRQQCVLSNNTAYVIFSASGSFYIPALIMTVVYAQVFIETRNRFRERARAAARLVNASLSSRPALLSHLSKIRQQRRHHHHHHHHYRHRRMNSNEQIEQHKFPSTLPLEANRNSRPSLFTENSTGSALEYYSVDDADELSATKLETSYTSAHQHPAVANHNQKHDFDISPTSFSSSHEETKILPIAFEPSVINGEATCSIFSQSSLRESKSDHESFNQDEEDQDREQQQNQQQQQNVSVQTNDLSKSLPKDSNRKILFKGKSLATLMHERQKISLTRERRLSRTLGIIISVFLLCWLPFFVVYILTPFVNIDDYVKEPLPTLILWLGYINSAVNPLIYTVFNVEFRTAFKRLLFPRSCTSTHVNKHRK